MMTNQQRQTDVREAFWQLTDANKMSEKFRIDQNLKFLKYAPLETLKKIFIQYRFFTHYYITDLAILVSKLPLGNLRSILAEILDEELGEGKMEDSHPQLYDNFLLSLGIPDHWLNQANLQCINYLRKVQESLVSKSWSYGVGLRGMGGECLCQIYLSTMHEYFSQNVVIVNKKNDIAWKFWDIHIGEADLYHQKIVRAAIDELLLAQPEVTDDLINGYLESKAAWDGYWQQIFKAARDRSKMAS